MYFMYIFMIFTETSSVTGGELVCSDLVQSASHYCSQWKLTRAND